MEKQVKMSNKESLSIITGGSGGIGREAVNLLSETTDVCYNLDQHEPKDKSPQHWQVNLTDREEVQKIADSLENSELDLQSLIIGSEVGIHEKLLEGDQAKWKRAFDINVMAPLYLVRAFLPYVRKGKVIFISSLAAEKIDIK